MLDLTKPFELSFNIGVTGRGGFDRISLNYASACEAHAAAARIEAADALSAGHVPRPPSVHDIRTQMPALLTQTVQYRTASEAEQRRMRDAAQAEYERRYSTT